MEATSIEALLAQLAHDNPRWRAEAEARLSRAGLAAVPALRKALKSPIVSVRVHAAQAVGNLVHELGARAYSGVSSGGVPAPLEELCELLADAEANGAAAIAAEKALVQLGAVTALLPYTEGPTGPRALRALGLLGSSDEGSIAVIRERTRSADTNIRREAAVALLRCLGDKATGETAALLSDPDKWVRYAVAEELAKLGDLRARPVLEEAIKDGEEPWIAGWAADLLDRLEGP